MRAFFLMLLFLSGVSNAADRSVTVSGECSLEVDPDRGSVILVAEHQDKDAKAAIRSATAQHEKLKSALKKAKLKDLEISSVEYSVQEVTEWENNRAVKKGFQCRIGLRVVTPEIPALGEVLSIADESGIRNTHSLQTYLSDSKLLEEKKRCLAMAAGNAREKAQHLVKSLNASLGPVQSIRERGTAEAQPVPMPRVFSMKSADAEAGPAPSIEGGKQTVRHEVEVTFSIER
jgi:uncharacterized protein YggE